MLRLLHNLYKCNIKFVDSYVEHLTSCIVLYVMLYRTLHVFAY